MERGSDSYIKLNTIILCSQVFDINLVHAIQIVLDKNSPLRQEEIDRYICLGLDHDGEINKYCTAENTNIKRQERKTSRKCL